MKPSYLTATDGFCGAGGNSIGLTEAGVRVEVALNHWPRAIETHQANFPETYHECVDISQCNPRRYRPTHILVMSPECTHHTLAGGNKRYDYAKDVFGNPILDPAAERSRATMWDVPRFAEFHDYELVVVENVAEAANWRMWHAWLEAMHCLDYVHQVVSFNSMFAHPTPQTRDRIYIVFSKKGNPRPNLSFTPKAPCLHCERDVEAIQSWKNPAKTIGKYLQQYIYCCPSCSKQVYPYYYPAASAIDFSLPSERICDRKAPLSERTMNRVVAGCAKFAGDAFTVQTGHGGPENAARVRSLLRPWPTQATTMQMGLIQPFILTYNGNPTLHPVSDPLTTITTKDRHGIIEPQSLDPDECRFRMMTAREAQAAMAFPETYRVLGTQAERVKQLGNAVTPPVMTTIVRASIRSLGYDLSLIA